MLAGLAVDTVFDRRNLVPAERWREIKPQAQAAYQPIAASAMLVPLAKEEFVPVGENVAALT